MTEEQWNPGKLLALSGSYWQPCAFHAAVELDLFTAIGNDSRTAQELAEKIQAKPRALEMLLNAMVAMGLLSKTKDSFSNTSASLEYLCTDASGYIGYMIKHHHHLVESWGRLHESVRSGTSVSAGIDQTGDEWRENFLMGMFTNARLVAPRLAENIDLTDRRHLIDVGGGPGTYAISFCQANTNLHATVFDLPTTKPFAEKVVGRYGLSDRITFIEGDYLIDEIPGSYDAAWLSHILHQESPEQSMKLIQKVVAALKPGALIAVHDFILDDTKDNPLFPALFSLNMLAVTKNGQAYSEAEIYEMFSKAGIKKIRRLSVDTPNDSGVMVGEV
jgi:SAM-dependent methyltransferase